MKKKRVKRKQINKIVIKKKRKQTYDYVIELSILI